MRNPRHDTGLCRICCRRKNLNAGDNIVRHSHMSYRCDGSNMKPAPDTVQRALHARIDRPSAKERQIALIQRQIEAGNLDREGLARAEKTIRCLENGEAFA